MAEKSRVSYPPGLRKEAKASDKGLITISIEFPDKTRQQVQLAADPFECHFAKWLAWMLQNHGDTPLPDVAEIYGHAGITE